MGERYVSLGAKNSLIWCGEPVNREFGRCATQLTDVIPISREKIPTDHP